MYKKNQRSDVPDPNKSLLIVLLTLSRIPLSIKSSTKLDKLA